MDNSKSDRSFILKNGIFDLVSGTHIEVEDDDKRLTPGEVATVFAEDELQMLMEGYKCLNETPQQIVDKICEEVIGQREAIEKLVHVAYFNQFANLMEEVGIGEMIRINALLIGDTGCGKTCSINALKKHFKVPLIKYSADNITSAGYIGRKVEDILIRLFEEANGDLALAERGIIYIDEFDKKVEQQTSAGKDVNGKAVQEELLKILEPNRIDLHLSDNRRIPFDTGRLTVFLGGAFVGLSDIRKKRLCKTCIGFKTDEKELSEDDLKERGYIPQDIIKFGFIPELVGRIKLFDEYRRLNTNDIMDIMLVGKNSIYIKYTKLLANVLNVEQQISKKFLEKVSDELINTGTGARALEARVVNIFYPIVSIAFEHRNEYGILMVGEDGMYSLEYEDITYYGDMN